MTVVFDCFQSAGMDRDAFRCYCDANRQWFQDNKHVDLSCFSLSNVSRKTINKVSRR